MSLIITYLSIIKCFKKYKDTKTRNIEKMRVTFLIFKYWIRFKSQFKRKYGDNYKKR